MVAEHAAAGTEGWRRFNRAADACGDTACTDTGCDRLVPWRGHAQGCHAFGAANELARLRVFRGERCAADVALENHHRRSMVFPVGDFRDKRGPQRGNWDWNRRVSGSRNRKRSN